jgi:hypothetical protein
LARASQADVEASVSIVLELGKIKNVGELSVYLLTANLDLNRLPLFRKTNEFQFSEISFASNKQDGRYLKKKRERERERDIQREKL